MHQGRYAEWLLQVVHGCDDGTQERRTVQKIVRVGLAEQRPPSGGLCLCGNMCSAAGPRHYDRGADGVCREVISFSGSALIRLQTLPEQKNLPSTQASTRSEFVPFMVIVA
jgi:hypothetical protein